MEVRARGVAGSNPVLTAPCLTRTHQAGVALPVLAKASLFLWREAVSWQAQGQGLPWSRRGDWSWWPAGCCPAAGSRGLGSSQFLQASLTVAATLSLPHQVKPGWSLCQCSPSSSHRSRQLGGLGRVPVLWEVPGTFVV